MPQDLKQTVARLASAAGHASRPETAERRFLRWQDLETDVRRLAAQLPWPIAGIIGCPRSGLYVAARLAIAAGVQLWSGSRTAPPIPLGHGRRLADAGFQPAGPLVLIEDSTNTGQNLADCRRHCPPDTITAAVYANPTCKIRPDLVAHWLPLPHYFEWHYFGSKHAETTAFDLDGIFADDCPPPDDDDGPRYAAWLQSVQPRAYCRTYTAGAIVTARLARYRPETETWLTAHGIRYRSLIMGPWPTKAERSKADIARWKADQYLSLPALKLFIESSPSQARRIAAYSGRPVACASSGELWNSK